jgi:hypothetical protein
VRLEERLSIAHGSVASRDSHHVYGLCPIRPIAVVSKPAPPRFSYSCAACGAGPERGPLVFFRPLKRARASVCGFCPQACAWGYDLSPAEAGSCFGERALSPGLRLGLPSFARQRGLSRWSILGLDSARYSLPRIASLTPAPPTSQKLFHRRNLDSRYPGTRGFAESDYKWGRKPRNILKMRHFSQF